MPSANAPRHVARNDSRSNHKEYCRAENGEYPPHRGILHVRGELSTTQKNQELGNYFRMADDPLIGIQSICRALSVLANTGNTTISKNGANGCMVVKP